MKVGDKIPVTIAGQQVTEAVIKELADGTVTLEFPATRAVMGVRTEIDTTPITPTGGTEHAILGIEPQTPVEGLPPVVPEAPAIPQDASTQPVTVETPAPADGAVAESNVVAPEAAVE